MVVLTPMDAASRGDPTGCVYVAVSAQHVGVESGESLLGADMSPKTLDPQRYASLNHPGDAFAFDILSQIGRLLRDAEHADVLGSLTPRGRTAGG
jgi:hypothetical protein